MVHTDFGTVDNIFRGGGQKKLVWSFAVKEKQNLKKTKMESAKKTVIGASLIDINVYQDN